MGKLSIHPKTPKCTARAKRIGNCREKENEKR
jgi:hypothetical protein